MEKAITTEVLNERLRFAGKSRAELAAEIDKKRHCTEEMLKASLTKVDRPIYYEINRMAATVTAAWVKARQEELVTEIKTRFQALANEDIEVLHPDIPTVIVVSQDKLIGVYDPERGRLY